MARTPLDGVVMCQRDECEGCRQRKERSRVEVVERGRERPGGCRCVSRSIPNRCTDTLAGSPWQGREKLGVALVLRTAPKVDDVTRPPRSGMEDE